VSRWQGPLVVAGACAAAIVVVVSAGLAFRAFRRHQAESAPIDTTGVADAAVAAQEPVPEDAAALASSADAAVNPALTAGLRVQEKAAAAKHRWTDVIETTRSIIQTDPSAVNDDALLGDVRNAALDPSHLEAGMGLIVTMGSRGADLLYDMAYSPWSVHFAKARARATQLLHTPEMRNHVSPALDVTLILRDGAPCDAKPTLDRASTDGDFRTTAVLRPWTSMRGCGAGKAHDCFACLHGDDALTKTIAAIDARSPDPNRPK
jgi:hypothetical protein